MIAALGYAAPSSAELSHSDALHRGGTPAATRRQLQLAANSAPPLSLSPPPLTACLENLRATGVHALSEGSWGTSDPQLWAIGSGGEILDRTEIRYDTLEPRWRQTMHLEASGLQQVKRLHHAIGQCASGRAGCAP